MTLADQQWRYVGQSMARREDARLVRGKGTFVSDLGDEGTWSLAVVRSPHAHARILAIDTHEAEAMPGVYGVFTALSHPEFGRPMPEDRRQSPLAAGTVRYVGEPVAFVLAENRYRAEDAVEAVRVQYDVLKPVSSVEEALTGAVLLHPDLGSNVADRVTVVRGLGEAGLKEADVVVEMRVSMGRVSPQALEPRAIFARYEAEREGLVVYYATQSVFAAQRRIAEFLGMEVDRVRVIAPDVGGGFGAKNGAYPEEFLATWAAFHFRRSVKWVGDRFEEFLATTQEREQVHYAKLGVARTGRIVALVDTFYQDNGAYPNRGHIPFHHTAENLLGPYAIPHVAIEGHMVLTSKVPQAPYRGAGRPQGHFVIERLLDRAADALGMDRADIRLANLYGTPGVPKPANYDNGAYAKTFQTLLETIGYRDLREKQTAWRQTGRYLGIGVASSVEISGGQGFEGARFTLRENGTVAVATGAVAHGQGHRTALAQIAADALALPMEQVWVEEGDTGAVARGIGTFGSRTMMAAGNAVHRGGRQFAEMLRALAAEMLEASPLDLSQEGERYFVRGVPAKVVTLAELAAYVKRQGRPPLVHEEDFPSKSPAYGFGAHAALVEVDPDTARVKVLDYTVVHDGGTVINPLTATGQVMGGVVQGLGTALWEEMRYDSEGQPLTTTFLDYHLPSIAEMPDMQIVHISYPAPHNPMGIKGVGEAGIIPTQAVILSAIEDALAPWGVRLDHAPVTAGRLFDVLNTVQARP
ncbi:MAG: xanthine dehydrogenase family protein molybdopterin-binding subunit [Firmicutes bacterium]|nr:xanthine dehydrogenase family protein molybdopterin-binding subunit [Bacillota bacterium]